MKNKLWIKIFVPVLIAAFIGGIWIVKNVSKNPADNPTTSQNDPTHSQNSTDPSDPLKGADFSLHETEAIDFEALAAYGLPMIIDYGADTCVPCKQMAPVLEKANREFKGKAFIKFINVWEHPNAANNVPIQVIPTQVLFNADGTPFVPSEELSKKLYFDMFYDKKTGEHTFTIHQGGLTEEQMWAILKEMGVV